MGAKSARHSQRAVLSHTRHHGTYLNHYFWFIQLMVDECRLLVRQNAARASYARTFTVNMCLAGFTYI